MNTKGLSLNSIPPINIPLRFFLTAPLFGILAAVLVMFYGTDLWSSRWSNSSLALTHLFTIGFMMMIMIGALYQFIPVMIGQLIPGSKRLVPVIHPLLTIGTLVLVSGFLFHHSSLYWLSFISLGIGLLLFSFSLIPLLFSRFKNQLIVYLLRILFLVLLISIGLGLFMLLAYSLPEPGIIYRTYTNLHALWGLLGWVVLLIMAVSSQVIPMFFVTPEFSVAYLKGLSLIIVITLLFLSFYEAEQFLLIEMLLSIELAFFSFYTLYLISQRRRKLADVTIKFIRLALVSLLMTLGLWWVFKQWPEEHISFNRIHFEFTIALLLIYGLALSAIIGMLQKIVPFLIYLNLQSLAFNHPGSIALVPNMKKIISTRHSQIQFYCHIISLLVLTLSIYLPGLVWIAGLAMLANFIWLFFCLFKAFLLFLNNKTDILGFPELQLKF